MEQRSFRKEQLGPGEPLTLRLVQVGRRRASHAGPGPPRVSARFPSVSLRFLCSSIRFRTVRPGMKGVCAFPAVPPPFQLFLRPPQSLPTVYGLIFNFLPPLCPISPDPLFSSFLLSFFFFFVKPSSFKIIKWLFIGRGNKNILHKYLYQEAIFFFINFRKCKKPSFQVMEA